jgi:hypothetical protein
MEPRMPRGVKEVILVRRDEQGKLTSRTVHRRKRKKKGGTAPLDTVGRAVRKVVSAQQDAVKTYLERHDESNREKSDGWLRDLPYNTYRAARRGFRKVCRGLGLPSIEVD